jgi:hypothetical protein
MKCCLQCRMYSELPVNGNFFPLFTFLLRHEGVWGSGCIDPRILDHGTSLR